MNNFQLNNTSVYLGGQCKWDIVVGNYNGQIYIQGFQLSPLSNNVPFNKRGSIDGLNENHSYTLKKYCDTLKENFWSVTPDMNQKLKKDSVEYYSDNSFFAGTRRSSCYPVYHKQFECLQPVWLEKLDKSDIINFSFNLYSENGNVLDSKVFALSHLDVSGDVEKEKIFSFHNKFVKYFYDWLKMLDIMGATGNNKILNLNLQKGIAQVEGVSTLSGQKVNPVSCDYVCHNLLSYERPNIESDYILTSLLKSHNLIASQLFNLCFCFNLEDVVNPFFSNQLVGNNFSMGVDVYIGENLMERRTLYTNYEFIKKRVSDPYLQLFRMDVTSTGELKPKTGYEVIYDFNGEEGGEYNVLDYLRDYSIPEIKDINKLSPQIIHWDFIDHNQDVFNLYNGYSGLNSFGGDETQIGSSKKFKVELYESPRLDGTPVVWVDGIPTQSNGALNWINPTKIITVTNLNDMSKIIEYTESKNCVLYQEGLWTYDKSNLVDDSEQGDFLKNLKNVELSFIYIKDSAGWDGESTFFRPTQWKSDKRGSGNSICVILKRIVSTQINTSDHFIIMTNNLEWFGVEKLRSDNLWVSDNKFKGYIESISKIIKQMNNKLYFYGFGTEIEVGKDELDMNCYYKSNKHSIYIYRRCGELTPCLKSDPNFFLDYQYCQSIGDNNIFEITNDFAQGFEYKGIDRSKSFCTISELNYTVEKLIDDEGTVKDLVKKELQKTYRLGDGDTELLDYIYNLYNITFKYEYASEKDVKTVEYKIKLILK